MKKNLEKSMKSLVVLESFLIIFNIFYYYWIKTILVGFYLILFFISFFITIALLILLLYIMETTIKEKERARG
ncbi:MAG: hypothetical protein ACTSYC_08380 [Promethearchaeota archaeon]